MSSTHSEILYRCPLCEAPAPTVSACKIHITRCNDEVHWGYVGDDLHEEIVEHQLVTDRGLVTKLQYLIAESRQFGRLRRIADGLRYR